MMLPLSFISLPFCCRRDIAAIELLPLLPFYFTLIADMPFTPPPCAAISPDAELPPFRYAAAAAAMILPCRHYC